VQEAPRYSYLLCDLLTDQKIARPALQGVSFERRIGYAGGLSAHLECPDAQTVALAKTIKAYCGRSSLYVFRNGALWWGGIVWTAPVKKDGRGGVGLDISAATFESYANHRTIRDDLSYAQVDQGVIVADLWRKMQATTWNGLPSGDIGVIAVDQPTGIVRDREYLGTDGTPYGQRLTELADVSDGGPGPEWTIDVFANEAGTRSKRLRVGAPLGGDVVATFEGNAIESWSEVTDAVDGGTAFQARGSASGGDASAQQEPLVSSVHYADDLLARGWPLLDRTDDYADVGDADLLESYARGLAEREAGAGTTNSYTINVDRSSWQPNQIGMPIRLRQKDLWHTEMQSRIVRPVGYKVTAQERGQVEQVDLVFDEEAA
jgi:hypothetical protein